MHGTTETVRCLLADLRSYLHSRSLSDDLCGTVEIAVAEALNNIIEHAYAPGCEGPLYLLSAVHDGKVEIVLRDKGKALPGLNMPDGTLPDSDGPAECLPEGGFGWFLIHTLTDRLHYNRSGIENQLTLVFHDKA